jgi:hypothetical protein
VPVTPPRLAVLTDLPCDRTAYVTLGITYNTTADVLETMVAALRDERWNLIVTIGENGYIEHFTPKRNFCHTATLLSATPEPERC